MRVLLLTSVFIFNLTNVYAEPVMAKNGEIYQGTISINDHPTNKTCKIEIQSKTDVPMTLPHEP